MRIGIDISQLQYGSSGITNSIKGLISVLANSSHKVILFKNFRAKVDYDNAKTFYFPFRNWKLRTFWDNYIIGNLAKFYKIDILITPYFSTPRQKNIFKIPVIHDLGVFEKESKNSKAIDYFKSAIENSMERAHAIIAVSKTIKKEILSRFPHYKREIIVLYNIIKKQGKDDYAKDPNLFLYLGAIEKRKNPLLALKVFEKILDFNKDAHLIFAGIIRDEYKNEFYKKFNSLHSDIRKNITILGYIDNDKKNKLLKKAVYLLYLSSYEGFGIPIIEAFYSKTIPILNTTPIAKEVGGTGGIYLDFNKEKFNFDFNLLFNKNFQKEMIQKGQKALTHYKKRLKIQIDEFLKVLLN